jgi:hypothetical protein
MTEARILAVAHITHLAMHMEGINDGEHGTRQCVYKDN